MCPGKSAVSLVGEGLEGAWSQLYRELGIWVEGKEKARNTDNQVTMRQHYLEGRPKGEELKKPGSCRVLPFRPIQINTES